MLLIINVHFSFPKESLSLIIASRQWKTEIPKSIHSIEDYFWFLSVRWECQDLYSSHCYNTECYMSLSTTALRQFLSHCLFRKDFTLCTTSTCVDKTLGTSVLKSRPMHVFLCLWLFFGMWILCTPLKNRVSARIFAKSKEHSIHISIWTAEGQVKWKWVFKREAHSKEL